MSNYAPSALDSPTVPRLRLVYNNSIGTVRDIVFSPGDDPNSGDLPQYVAVEFTHYNGPVWDQDNPKVSMNKN